MSTASEPLPSVLPDRHVPKPRSIAVSAGLGAAFGNLLWLAIVEIVALWESSRLEVLDKLIAIALVSIGVVKFLEPLIERLGHNLGISKEHGVGHSGKPMHLRVAAFLILTLTSLSHGVLHERIGKNPWSALGLVVGALAIPGAITYAWTLGARQRAPRAAQMGAISGAFFGGTFVFLIWALSGGYFFVEGELTKLTLEQGEKLIIFAAIVPWLMMGFAGGVAIDKRWSSRPARSAAVAIVATGVAYVLVVLVAGGRPSDVLNDASKMIGWALGLIIIEHDADACFKSGEGKGVITE